MDDDHNIREIHNKIRIESVKEKRSEKSMDELRAQFGNRYVNFVSDEHFFMCVSWVCDEYLNAIKKDESGMWRNGRDPFKMIFDLMNREYDFGAWVADEKIRQDDKSINNRIGGFHQKLLGGVDGWIDLESGDATGLDLKNNHNTVFVELKNKFNTVNSSSLETIRKKCVKVLKEFPRATCYWAYISNKDGTSGECAWIHKKENNPRLKEIWGSNVYTMITGRSDALQQTWKAIPRAINDFYNTKFEIQDHDDIEEHFQSTFFS